MRKAKLTPGEFVEIPYYCFAPARRGWNGWLFTSAQVIKVAGVNKYGKKVLTLDVCNPDGRNGEHYEKDVCEDRIFARHDVVEFAQKQVDRAPASEYSGGRYNTVVYWLADKGLVTGLRERKARPGGNEGREIKLMATKEAKRRAVAKYDATHTRFYGFKLNEATDKDIIEYLDNVPNKQAAFKQAMRLLIESGN